MGASSAVAPAKKFRNSNGTAAAAASSSSMGAGRPAPPSGVDALADDAPLGPSKADDAEDEAAAEVTGGYKPSIDLSIGGDEAWKRPPLQAINPLTDNISQCCACISRRPHIAPPRERRAMLPLLHAANW